MEQQNFCYHCIILCSVGSCLSSSIGRVKTFFKWDRKFKCFESFLHNCFLKSQNKSLSLFNSPENDSFPRHDVLRCASNDKLTATRFFPSRDVTVSSKGRKTSNNPVIYISPPFIAAHSNEQFTAEKKIWDCLFLTCYFSAIHATQLFSERQPWWWTAKTLMISQKPLEIRCLHTKKEKWTFNLESQTNNARASQTGTLILARLTFTTE